MEELEYKVAGLSKERDSLQQLLEAAEGLTMPHSRTVAWHGEAAISSDDESSHELMLKEAEHQGICNDRRAYTYTEPGGPRRDSVLFEDAETEQSSSTGSSTHSSEHTQDNSLARHDSMLGIDGLEEDVTFRCAEDMPLSPRHVVEEFRMHFEMENVNTGVSDCSVRAVCPGSRHIVSVCVRACS